MRKALTLLVLVPCLMLSVAGKKDKKKKKGKKDERVGWVKPSEEASGACYYKPNFEEMTSGPRKIARSEAIEAVLSQWKGERGDGVTMPEKYAYDIETVLLGDPKDIEVIIDENTEWCEKRMAGEATDAAWAEWVAGLSTRLTKGECKGSLLPREMHDYLNISGEWHMKMPFCKGDKVIVSASTKDLYRVREGGPWITIAGELGKSVTGDQWACTLEGCYHGTLVARFRNYDGTIEQIFPVGSGATEYTCPDHGYLEVMINDDAWHDNVWKVEGGMQHHAGVSYLPG